MDRLSLDAEEWKEFVHALELFNNKYFWECHEVLEDIWMTKSPPLKTFIQGIIQAAAMFYHVLNENPQGVVKLASDSMAKLEGFLPEHANVPIKDLIQSLKDFQFEAKQIIEGKAENFNLPKIPVIPIPVRPQ